MITCSLLSIRSAREGAVLQPLGFTRAGWPALHRILLDLAVRGEATMGQKSDYGQKYEVRGTIQGPAGHEAQVVTVWIVLIGEDFHGS